MARYYKSISIARTRAAAHAWGSANQTILKPPRKAKKRD